MADGSHGPQTSIVWDMGVPTHWGGAINCGAGWYRSIYFPPPEHGRTIYFDLSYRGLVSGGGVEDLTEPIQVMVGSAWSGYPWYKSGAWNIGGGGWRYRYIESRLGEDGRRETEMTRRTRDNQTYIWGIWYNVGRNPIGTVPNATLASDLVRYSIPRYWARCIYMDARLREKERETSQK